MSAHPMVLDLPEDIYERVERAARGLRRPLNDALLWIVRAGLPSLSRVPLEFRADLEALEGAGDAELWRVFQAQAPELEQRRLSDLLAGERAGGLSEAEGRELGRLHAEADRRMLRKSYAAVLLKWRGHDVPKPEGF